MFYWCLEPGRLAILERWLPNTVAILDKFHCIINMRYLKATYSSNSIHHLNNSKLRGFSVFKFLHIILLLFVYVK